MDFQQNNLITLLWRHTEISIDVLGNKIQWIQLLSTIIGYIRAWMGHGCQSWDEYRFVPIVCPCRVLFPLSKNNFFYININASFRISHCKMYIPFPHKFFFQIKMKNFCKTKQKKLGFMSWIKLNPLRGGGGVSHAFHFS